MDKENKTVNINIRVSDSTKKALQKLADNDQRTLSDWIRLQLDKIAVNGKKK
jgi:mRNA-degrading endonuclease RelE of RelBE toxin-antitoxin system